MSTKSSLVSQSFVLCLLTICVTGSQAIAFDLFKIVDLSNVDLLNYQYFQNFPSQNPATAAHANLFLEHFQRKKAVLDYFANLLFGQNVFVPETQIIFDPNFGRAWRPHFERKYGRHGEHLVAALGHGYSLEDLRKYGAIPYGFGRIYYPS